MKIALVGMSDQAKEAPFGESGWEVWGMAWHAEVWARFDRVFEMHDMSDFHEHFSDSYIERLKDIDCLYMQEKYFDNVTPYPFDEVGNYYTSSIGYMLALAISMEPEEIQLHGVYMADESEYRHQRANAEYLIGFAEGKGIKVTIPNESELLKYQPHYMGFPYTNRYGWTQ